MRDESVRYYDAVSNGYMTVNEVRILHGLSPIAEGDTLYKRMEGGSYEIVGSRHRGITEDRLRQLVDEATYKHIPKLLTIELTEESAIPRVVYNGEVITRKKAVEFLWHTNNEHGPVKTYINIEAAVGESDMKRITYNPDSADVKRFNFYGDPVDA